MAFIQWTGGAGNASWNTAANWYVAATGAAAVPGALDDVWIPPSAGVLRFAGDTGSVNSISVGQLGVSGALDVLFGAGIEATDNLSIYSGVVRFLGDTGDIVQQGGMLTIDTDDAINALNVHGGTCYPDRHGTLTGLLIGATGLVDFTRTTIARTVTGVTISEAGARMRRNAAHVTITNGITLNFRGGLRSTALN